MVIPDGDEGEALMHGLQARIGCATLPAGIQWTGLPAPLGGPLP